MNPTPFPGWFRPLGEPPREFVAPVVTDRVFCEGVDIDAIHYKRGLVADWLKPQESCCG